MSTMRLRLDINSGIPPKSLKRPRDEGQVGNLSRHSSQLSMSHDSTHFHSDSYPSGIIRLKDAENIQDSIVEELHHSSFATTPVGKHAVSAAQAKPTSGDVKSKVPASKTTKVNSENFQEEIATIKKVFGDDIVAVNKLVSAAELLGKFKEGTQKYREALDNFIQALSQVMDMSGKLAGLMTKQSVTTSKNEETQASKELGQLKKEWAAEKAEEDRPWFERLADIVVAVVEVVVNVAMAVGDSGEAAGGNPLAGVAAAASTVMAVQELTQAICTTVEFIPGAENSELRNMARNGFIPPHVMIGLTVASCLGGIGALGEALAAGAGKLAATAAAKGAADAVKEGAAEGLKEGATEGAEAATEKAAQHVTIQAAKDAEKNAAETTEEAIEGVSAGSASTSKATEDAEENILEAVATDGAENAGGSTTTAGTSTIDKANKEVLEEEDSLIEKLISKAQKAKGEAASKVQKVKDAASAKAGKFTRDFGSLSKAQQARVIAGAISAFAGSIGLRTIGLGMYQGTQQLRTNIVKNQISEVVAEVDVTAAKASVIKEFGSVTVDVTKHLQSDVDKLEKSLDEAVTSLKEIMEEIAGAVIRTNEDIASRQLQM